MAYHVTPAASRSMPSRAATRAVQGVTRSAFWRRLVLAFSVGDERKRLSELTDAELADIGLTRDQALRESGRPIWDLPQRR